MPFLAGYTRRKKITIDNTHVDSTLTDFPLLVKFTDDAAIGADIDSNGYNIRFTSSDGETLLKYERQSFDNDGSTATGIFWVKVPSVSGSVDTEIYLYYKAASPSDGQDAANTWDANYKGVWHMEQDPSGSAPQVMDSTANNNDGTSAGSMTSGDLVASQVGSGIDFDGSNDYIEVADSSWPVAAFTWSTWAKFADFANAFQFLLAKTLDNGAVSSGEFRQNSSNQKVEFCGNSGISVVQSGTLSAGTWYCFAVTYDGTTTRLYVDGVLDNSTLNNAYSASGRPFRMGTRDDLYTYFKGVLDEINISSIARSAAWLKFTHRNQFEADNEILFGAEEIGQRQSLHNYRQPTSIGLSVAYRHQGRQL